MNVLITGIGGFAGSHLADYVLSHTAAKLSGTVMTGEKIDELQSHLPAIQVFPCDITNFESIRDVLSNVGPDIIFHLAGQAFVPSSLKSPSGTFEVNVIGSVNLIEATKACGIRPRILIVSSGEVYGGMEEGSTHPPSEIASLKPANLYAASKVAIDYIAQTYKMSEGLDIVIARPFNHIGPRQRPTFVCASLARQFALIKRNKMEPVIKTGNTKPRRDFTDVRDVVKAYWSLGEFPNDRYFIFNICSGNVFSIEDIITMFEEISGVRVRREVDQDRIRKNDIQLVTGNNELLTKLTGWQPAYSMRRTLTDLFEYWMETT